MIVMASADATATDRRGSNGLLTPRRRFRGDRRAPVQVVHDSSDHFLDGLRDNADVTAHGLGAMKTA
ncbi:hypothetical protein [Actinomadura nitritigenes]|uniref:hypothetical protein n=1 Tax=Actinomadura nitritigenes TaxID=134602 RepID=UPI003D8AF30D